MEENAQFAMVIFKPDNDNRRVTYNSMDESMNHMDKNENIETQAEKRIPLFEDIWEDIGAFGYWQRIIFVLISAADIFGAWAILLPTFVSATPDLRCADNSTYYFNTTDPDEEELCTSCDTIAYSDEFTSVISEWDLICGRRYIGSLVTSVQMAGLILGAVSFGQLSDLAGRKKSYYLAHGLICCAGLASAFANSWQLYAAFRFVVGTGFGGTMVVNNVYTVEFVGQRWRTLCGTIGFWGVGGMSLGLIAYLVRSWQHFTIITSSLGFVYFLSWPLVPESPRWLCEKGRFAEAESILKKIAMKNKHATPSIQTLKEYHSSEKMIMAMEKKYSYWHIFMHRIYCKRMIVLSSFWFVAFVIFYNLSFNVPNLSGNRYFNIFLSGVFDQLAMLSVIFFMNTVGRRWMMIIFMALTCIAHLVMLVLWATDQGESIAVVASAMIGKACALGGTYVVQIYTAELFPTVIRNLAMGAGSVCGRIATVIAPQVVFLGTYYPVAPYILCMLLSGLVMPLCFILPETTGKPLLDSYDQEH